MSSVELRVDASNGKPYTLQSFLETYENGQAIWDKAEVWNAGNGVLRIRTVPLSTSSKDNAAVVAAPEPLREQSPGPPVWEPQDFPSIGSKATSTAPASVGSELHYSRVVTPEEHSMSPEAPAFQPGDQGHLTLQYSQDKFSSNEQFETLPSALWNGAEHYPQPIADDENGCVDWEMMIQTWTPEQWHEFGIKYFYGYIQQSSLLMGAMPMSQEVDETPLDAWGNE